MEAKLIFKTKVGKRNFLLTMNCYANSTDVTIENEKYVSVLCHLPTVDEKCSHKDYKKVFEISPDGDFHILVEFKNNPKNIHVTSQYSSGVGLPGLTITIEGE